MELLNDALKEGIAPGVVLAVYLIITKTLDNKKENAQIKLSSDLTKSINVISEFLTDITKNIVDKDKDKCKNAVEDAMFSSGMRLIIFVSSTLINNHVETNKANILANISNIVNTEYYTIYSTLSMYKINGNIVSDYLDKEWMSTIEQDMVDIIYNNLLDKDDKILSFSNKITLKFQTYVTYITNNIVK